MKIFNLLLILFLALQACKKEEFISCPEYEKLVGSYKSINGDNDAIVIINSEGEFELFNEFERHYYFKGDYCEVKNNGDYMLLKRKSPNAHIYIGLEKGFDTLSFYAGSFNQPETSIDQKIMFLKTK